MEMLHMLKFSSSPEKFLVGVSGIPDFCVSLWDWAAEELLTTAALPAGPTPSSAGCLQTSFPPNVGGLSKMFLTAWPGNLVVWQIERLRDNFQIFPKALPGKVKKSNSRMMDSCPAAAKNVRNSKVK